MDTKEPKESQLVQLKAKALKAYSQKDYATSTELYASACELQSALHGENNPKNAHLLYLYGRSLFEVALKKSDVLGGVTQEEKKEKEKKEKKKSKDKLSEAPATGSEVAIGEQAEQIIPKAKAGLFQFTGDENWDDTDEEDEDEEESEEKAADEEDDFTLAWEILDYARVLFLKQLSPETIEANPVDSTTDTSTDLITSVPNEDAAAPAALSDDETRALKTALADVYDLLGEVSLESESFAQAAKDLRASLELKLVLYPTESTLISEAHYKLSLALEFMAAGEDVSDSERKKGREEAAEQMEMAIASCRARIEKEENEAELNTEGKGKEKEKVTKSLKDAREMVEELETRLADLRATDPLPLEVTDPLKGILGQVLGEDQAAARKRIEEAMSGARDLTGLVRKKTPAIALAPTSPTPATPATTVVVVPKQNGNGKRKLDDLVEEDEGKEEVVKKAKVDEVVEEVEKKTE